MTSARVVARCAAVVASAAPRRNATATRPQISSSSSREIVRVATRPRPPRRSTIARGAELSWDEAEELGVLELECATPLVSVLSRSRVDAAAAPAATRPSRRSPTSRPGGWLGGNTLSRYFVFSSLRALSSSSSSSSDLLPSSSSTKFKPQCDHQLRERARVRQGGRRGREDRRRARRRARQTRLVRRRRRGAHRRQISRRRRGCAGGFTRIPISTHARTHISTYRILYLL